MYMRKFDIIVISVTKAICISVVVVMAIVDKINVNMIVICVEKVSLPNRV